MTTVIDHAIAIPTRSTNVWEVIRDITKNPTWQPNSQRVQLLTTIKHGRGTRWRSTTSSNKEQVIEITAWYEGLGYEYRIVDGSSYPKNRGRIRLQEAPEGTIVQWSFSYEVNGIFGKLRNSLSMKGQADKQIVQGLRNLYTYIKEAKADDLMSPEESKSYLQEAPNVEERATYQPRYPKATSQEIPVVQIDKEAAFKPPAQDAQPTLASVIDEPPLTDEDTRPNPTIQQSETAQASDEPEFLKTMPDPQPMASSPTTETSKHEESISEPLSEETKEYSETVAASSLDDTIVGETGQTPLPDEKTLENEKLSAEHRATVEPLVEGRDTSKLDTSQISVFELFGLEKPSETEQVHTIQDKATEDEPKVRAVIQEPPKSFTDSTPIIPDIKPEISERRRGLRAALRRRLTNVRVPKS